MSIIIPRNYDDTQPLTEAQLDAAFDAVETLINVTKIAGSEIQSGAVDTANIADNAITAGKLAAAVAGDGLAGGAGTALSVSTDGSTLEISSDQVRVKALGIGTSHIAAGAVTRVKQESVGQQVSASSGAFSTTSSTYVDVDNLSVSITTSGRPVLLMLVSDGSGTQSEVGVQRAAEAASGVIAFDRGGSTISEMEITGAATGSGATSASLFVPASSIQHLDPVAAGTYSYKVRAKETDAGSSTVYVTLCKLVAFEL